tara:strand:+ start:121 stop:603 length:483 start_codon:yes stop_codon:yes gene_type:complete
MTNESAEEYIRRETNKEIKKNEKILSQIEKQEDEWKKKCSVVPGVYAISSRAGFYDGRSQRGLHILIVIIGIIILLLLILSSRKLYKINKNGFEKKITSFFLLIIILFVIIFPIIVIWKASGCIKERKNIQKIVDSIGKSIEEEPITYAMHSDNDSTTPT